MKKISSIFAIVLILLTACSSTGGPSAAQATATASSQPDTTGIKVFPTPSALRDSIIWDGLQVTMDQLEITQDYMTDYGSTRIPPTGQKFLWVQVRLENTGHIELDVPLSEHFSVLYAGTELKPSYGHRQGYTDYTTLGSVIFPNQKLDSWLRFDIPTAAELNELHFVFLPESSQVGSSFSSPNYPYAEDKPTYVWNCAP
jgi:surface antigen